jgi:pyruvoyl-dependent arginine decarboxylase (PvlArgDC)
MELLNTLETAIRAMIATEVERSVGTVFGAHIEREVEDQIKKALDAGYLLRCMSGMIQTQVEKALHSERITNVVSEYMHDEVKEYVCEQFNAFTDNELDAVVERLVEPMFEKHEENEHDDDDQREQVKDWMNEILGESRVLEDAIREVICDRLNFRVSVD